MKPLSEVKVTFDTLGTKRTRPAGWTRGPCERYAASGEELFLLLGLEFLDPLFGVIAESVGTAGTADVVGLALERYLRGSQAARNHALGLLAAGLEDLAVLLGSALDLVGADLRSRFAPFHRVIEEHAITGDEHPDTQLILAIRIGRCQVQHPL